MNRQETTGKRQEARDNRQGQEASDKRHAIRENSEETSDKEIRDERQETGDKSLETIDIGEET